MDGINYLAVPLIWTLLNPLTGHARSRALRFLLRTFSTKGDFSMEWKSISRISMVVIPVVIVCGLLVAASSVGPTARADNEDKMVCTDKTIQGDYGSQIIGTVLGPNLPFRGLARSHNDGEGHFTQVDHIVFNGIPPAVEWAPGTGTYTVNPDCTGSSVINSSSSPGPITTHFVVVNHGKQTLGVVDGNAVTFVSYKID
jgi:hypothetical protein